jgi:hypothetical protein
MTHPPINQLPLFCRQCNTSYENIDDDGICTVCETGNIYQHFNIPVTLSFDAYSLGEALGKVKELFEQLNIPLTINEAQ